LPRRKLFRGDRDAARQETGPCRQEDRSSGEGGSEKAGCAGKQGFHGFETDEGFRWTHGDARLPPEMFTGLAGSIEVVLHIGATAQYIASFAASRAA
jgi:hypothetical protein